MNTHPIDQSAVRSRHTLIFGLLTVALCGFFILSLLVGSVGIPLPEALKALWGDGNDPLSEAIIRGFRLPKALIAILAGSALSVSGLQMQTVFRNPLAGPYVLGISAGASLGVAIVLMGMGALGVMSASGVLGGLTMAGAAWLGAMLVLLLILAVSVRVKDIMTILILGIMFGAAASAIVSVLQFFSSESMLRSFVIWTMGSLSSVTGMQLWVLAIAVVIGLALSFASIRLLNVMMLGDAYSRTLGLNITLSRMLVFVSTSLLAGSVTAFCGPIGFIGIAIPHVARMLFRSANHAVLIPGSILLGSVAMLACDIVAQLPGQAIALPLNSITALLGVPIVIYVVIRNRKFMGV